jgi:peroxiredoxin
LADYRDHYEAMRIAGANLAAVSVDAPEKSEAVRRELRLPFPILSDAERRVVQEWDIYNPHEKGGIARPAVFILAPDRTVRFVSVDEIVSRVPAAEILRRLRAPADTTPAIRKRLIPGPIEFFRATGNAIRLGMRQSKSRE